MFLIRRRRSAVPAVIAALLGIAGPSATHAQTATPATTPPPAKVARITVVGNAHVSTADILAQLKSPPAPAANGTVRADDALVNVTAVRGMGLFQSAKVTSAPDPAGGADVTCTVVENPVVRQIKFTANTPDGQPSVPAATLIGRMRTAVGQVLNTNTLIKDLEGLCNRQNGYMRSRGYLCDVSTDINIDPNNGTLLIPLVEAHVDRVDVRGNGAVPAAEILDLLGVRPGDLLDMNAAARGVRHLAGTHRFAQQYIQSTPGDAGKATLTVTVRLPHAPSGTITPGPGKPTAVDYGGTLAGPVIVPVRVNDRITGHFLLMTGGDLSSVSTTFAAALGLTPQPMTQDGQPYVVDGQPASAVSLDRLVVGGTSGVDFREVSVGVTDYSTISKQLGQTVDGVLGADLLSRLALAVDIPRRRVTLWDHGGLSPGERSAAGFGGALAEALTPTDDHLPVLARSAVIRNGAASEADSLVLATESQYSLMPPAEADALGMTPLPDSGDPATVMSRATGVTAGDLSLPAPLFQLTDRAVSATLGLGVLQHYRLLLDGPGHMAYFAPEVTAAGADPGRRSLTVPFRYDPVTTPYPVVMVRINGRPPLPFVFDTGTSRALIVTPETARSLGLTVDPRPATVMNGVVPAGTAAVSSAVVQGRTPADDLHVSLEQAMVVDLTAFSDYIVTTHVAGFIGAGVLDGTAVRLDYPRRTLTFLPGRPDVPVPPGATVLPLTEGYTDGAYFVAARPVAGPPVRLLVDTGSVDTSLPFEMLGTLRPVLSRVAGQWTPGSVSVGQYLTMPRPPFGWMPPGPLTVGVYPTADGSTGFSAAGLGEDVLSRLSATLDIPHMRLLLAPLRPTPPDPRSGWTGADVAAQGSGFRVARLFPRSPAARAGLRPGDIVLAVDGRRLAGLSVLAARQLANGLAGTVAAFAVRRGGQALMVRFPRAGRSAAPPSPLDGLFGFRRDAVPFVVSAVLPGCPAARAGLAAGDTITTINGQPTPGMSLEQWDTLDEETRLTVTVTRGGASRVVVLSSERTGPKARDGRVSERTILRARGF